MVKHNFNSLGLECEIIAPWATGSFELMQAAYDTIFNRYFPEEAPYEYPAKWQSRMANRYSGSEYIVGISGKNLKTPENRLLTGLFVGVFYKKASTGNMAYNIVDEKWRGSGLGRLQFEMRARAMLQAAKNQGTPLHGIFAECHDPAKVDASHDLAMNPATRISIYAKLGGLRVPVSYVLPNGPNPQDIDSTMMLLAFPHPETGKYPTLQGIKRHLRGLYEVRGMVPEDFPDFLRMNRELDACYKKRRGHKKHWLLTPQG